MFYLLVRVIMKLLLLLLGRLSFTFYVSSNLSMIQKPNQSFKLCVRRRFASPGVTGTGSRWRGL